MLPKFWDSLLLDNLYPQLYMYQLGEKRRVPQGSGTTFYIPRWTKQNIVANETEGAVVGTCPMSAQFLSGTIKFFTGAYKHSDVVVMTSLSSVIEGSLREISKDIAKKIDTHIRLKTSAAGVFVGGGDAGTASASVGSADTILPRNIIQAETTLDANDNFRFPDGTYAGIVHPAQVYDLQTNISANAWSDINKYTANVENIYRGEIGRMFGVRFITSSNAKKRPVADSAFSAIASYSAHNSGYQALIVAPGAYHVVELDGAMAQTYVKGLGSAGTLDPVNQMATVGAKVFFECVANTLDTRQVRLNTAVTINP